MFFYTIIALLLWLSHDAPAFGGGFTPQMAMFLIAIIADLATHQPWKRG